MSILKLQQGAALPAYINYTPVTISSGRATTNSSNSEQASSSKKQDGITDKDLVKALDSLDALPNEVKEITAEIQNFILDQSMSLGEVDPTKMSLRYAALVGKMKIAKFNSEQYKDAFNQIKSNGGIHEIAVDTDGYVFCRSRQNPDDFERFTAEEYIANYRDYKALTNQELLELRAQSPSLIDNNEVLKIVSNGMGLQGIQQLINNAVNKIGTTTMQQQGYTQTQQAQISRGLEYIEQAGQSAQDVGDRTSVDGIYNLSVLSKDQQMQAQLALAYIYSALPKNARALLTIKAAEGGVPGGAKGLLNTLIQSKLDFTDTEKLSRSNNPSDKSSGKGKTTDIPEGVNPELAKLALTPVMMAQLGMSERKLLPMNQGTIYSSTNYAQVVPIVTKTGEAIGANSTLLDISQSQLAGALNLEDATMGGARISPDAIRKVAITSGNMYIINVPIDKNRPDGVTAPDLKYLKRLEKADQEIEAWKRAHKGQEITAEDINKIYKNNNLPLLMDSEGRINTTDYCKFAVFNGETKDKYLIPPPDGSDIIAQDISDPDSIQNYRDILSGNKETKDQEEFDENNWYDWNGHDTLYRATIFVPLSTNILSGAATSGANLQVKEAVGIYALNEQKERLKYYDADRASKYE